jgi:hypothetical protein
MRHNRLRRIVYANILILTVTLTFTAQSCGDKLEKASARAARVSVYAETARQTVPLFGPALNLPADKQARISAALSKARDFARELAITLDGIRTKAIDEATGKAKVRDLLAEISRGVDALEAEGFFNFPNLKPEIARAAHVAILGLRATVALLQSDLR